MSHESEHLPRTTVYHNQSFESILFLLGLSPS